MDNEVLYIPLKEFAEIESLSERAYNICNNNDLNNLKEILTFYESKRTFFSLHKCGKKTEKELMAICLKYNYFILAAINDTMDAPDTSVQLNTELLPKSLQDNCIDEELSIRAYHICNNNGLNSLEKILNFYEINSTFLNLHNCGKKTEKELIAFCAKYSNINTTRNTCPLLPNTLAYLEQFNNFSPFKEQLLNRFIEIKLLKSSKIFKTVINKLKSNQERLIFIFEPTLHNEFSKLLETLNKDALLESEQLKNDVSLFIEYLNTLTSNEALVKENTCQLLLLHGFLSSEALAKINFDLIHYENGKIKLLRLLKIIIEDGNEFNEMEKLIFNNSYSIDLSSYPTAKEIARMAPISKERVRQIKSKLIKKIRYITSFIINIMDDAIEYLDIKNSPIVIINDVFSQKINALEGSDFNSNCFNSIFEIYLGKSHTSLNIYKNLNIPVKPDNKYYLVKRNIIKEFKVLDFIEDIDRQLSIERTSPVLLKFEDLIDSWTPFGRNNSEYSEEIKNVSKTLLADIYNLTITKEGILYLPQNVKRPLFEYIISVLEETNDVMKVDDIYNTLIAKFPTEKFAPSMVRRSLQQEKDLFIFFGRTSTYGLKKWEEEKDNIKGGTIRKLVEQFLELTQFPRHISDILTYILKYRNTSERSLIQNIELDKNEIFTVYDGGFIGLNREPYNIGVPNYKRIESAHFRDNYFRKMYGLEIDKVVDYYVTNYGYEPIQIKHAINKKIESGLIQISGNKIVESEIPQLKLKLE